MRNIIVLLIALFCFSSATPALAQKPFAILMPGAGGATPTDFLVRNVARFRRAGIETVVLTDPRRAVQAAAGQPDDRTVVIVGMSKGALHTAMALKLGIKVDGAVFVSGGGRQALRVLGGRRITAPMLWVHHVKDACDKTPFAGAQAFAAKVHGRVTLVPMRFSGTPAGPVCGPRHAHGFYQRDAKPVKAITDFIKGL